MYYIKFFVPEESCNIVKNALFNMGAGKIKNKNGVYDHCCFISPSVGQFRPLENSNPYIGSVGKFENTKELQVEMVCDDELIMDAIKVLKKSHPYEEPPYEICELLNI